MSEPQGMNPGAVVIHVLVSVLAAFGLARMLASGSDIVISAEIAASIGMTAVGIVSAVLFKWRQRRAAGGLTTGQMVAERLAEVERREEEVALVHARLAELEERLDFSERLLAQGAPESVADWRREP